LEEVAHLNSCGLRIKVTRSFTDKEVICDYVEKLLSHKTERKIISAVTGKYYGINV